VWARELEDAEARADPGVVVEGVAQGLSMHQDLNALRELGARRGGCERKESVRSRFREIGLPHEERVHAIELLIRPLYAAPGVLFDRDGKEQNPTRKVRGRETSLHHRFARLDDTGRIVGHGESQETAADRPHGGSVFIQAVDAEQQTRIRSAAEWSIRGGGQLEPIEDDAKPRQRRNLRSWESVHRRLEQRTYGARERRRNRWGEEAIEVLASRRRGRTAGQLLRVCVRVCLAKVRQVRFMTSESLVKNVCAWHADPPHEVAGEVAWLLPRLRRVDA
jgi:hypothetical protein